MSNVVHLVHLNLLVRCEGTVAAITGQPAYRQVAADLRAKIRAGSYAPGAPLPSTRQLMDAYDVSITVVRAAVNQLRLEGLVIGQPGKGVYVVEDIPAAADDDDLAEIRHQLDALRSELITLNDRLARVEQHVGDSPPPPRD